MYFKLRYAVDMSLGLDEGQELNFPYGGDHRVVVRIFEQVVDRRKSLFCEGLCERDVDKSVQDSFERATAGDAEDSTHRAFFKTSLSELYDYMPSTVKILRWRCSVMD